MRMLKMLPLVLLASAAATTCPLSALDAPGAPAWLAKPWQAAWRLAPMTEVLADLARASGLKVEQSGAARQLTGDRRVVLIDAAPATLGATLERLERTQGVRFSALPGTLRLTTPQEFMSEHAEARWYDLAAYGFASLPRDLPARALGLEDRRGDQRGPTAGYTIFTPASPPLPGLTDWTTVLELLTSRLGSEETSREGASFDQRGPGLHITTTPDVHERIGAILAGLAAPGNRRTAWRAQYGLLPAGERFATGILERAAAAAVAERLTDAQTLVTTGVLGQTVHAAARQDRAVLDRADAVNFHLDPGIDVLRLGRSLEIHALKGQAVELLSYRLAWVEDAGAAPTTLARTPDHALPEVPVDGKGPATAPAGPPMRGERVPLELPVLWSWRPAGDVFLVPGQALVLTSEHPAGQAVIVLMEEQP